MTNPITSIFSNMSDNELIRAINEIREDEPLGIIRIGGTVRRIAQSISELTGESLTMHLTMAQVNLWREAANRFSKKVDESRRTLDWWRGLSGDGKSRISKKYFNKEFYELTKLELEEILKKETTK